MRLAGVVSVMPVEDKSLRDIVDLLVDGDFYEKPKVLSGDVLLLIPAAVLLPDALPEHCRGVPHR